MLINRPDFERKVGGAGLATLAASLVIVLLRHFFPEEAEKVTPYVEPALLWLSATLGGYFTRSRAVP